jgi:hypothetical protein
MQDCKLDVRKDGAPMTSRNRGAAFGIVLGLIIAFVFWIALAILVF